MSRTAVLAFAALLAGFPASAQEPKKPDTNLDNHKDLAAAVAKADKVVLYEGLPHQLFEKELLEKELKEKKTVKFNGFPFYEETLTLKEEDKKKLTTLFGEEKSVKKFSGQKRCGGFHPDYCVEWHVGKDVYRAHMCFGCHEMMVFGPKTDLYCDIADPALKELDALLKAYRKNRPKRD